MNVTYQATTAISYHKGHTHYYPVVKFYSSTISDSYYINDPQPTRARAKTIARKHIANIKK